jgi:methylisocitrate lyase
MPVMTVTVADKRSAFRALHQSGCFVLPNPWDVGSAQLLQAMGFKALASTSSGMAWSMGRRDNHVGVEDVLTHLARLCAATDLPVNADFEAGFADTPEGVAANVTRAVATGIAGLSIEDSTGRNAEPLYDKSLAVARIKAARTALDAAASDVLLVGRCETFLVGQPDLALAIDRLGAYAEAGADCLYAPGLRTRDCRARQFRRTGRRRFPPRYQRPVSERLMDLRLRDSRVRDVMSCRGRRRLRHCAQPRSRFATSSCVLDRAGLRTADS